MTTVYISDPETGGLKTFGTKKKPSNNHAKITYPNVTSVLEQGAKMDDYENPTAAKLRKPRASKAAAKMAEDEKVREYQREHGEPPPMVSPVGAALEAIAVALVPEVSPITTPSEGGVSVTPGGVEFGGGRPNGYYTPDGRRCVSVTTVLGKFDSKGGLLHWYYKNGMTDGLRHAKGEPLIGAENFARDAMAIGSAVHARVESILLSKDQPGEMPDEALEKQAALCFSSWREWYEGAALTPVAIELPLLHAERAVGGTVDAVLRDKSGKLVLLDWKTSKEVYPQAIIQTAAYRWLWEEELREEIARCVVLRIDKETGRRRVVEMNARELIVPTDQWLRFVDAYRASAEIEKLLK